MEGRKSRGPSNPAFEWSTTGRPWSYHLLNSTFRVKTDAELEAYIRDNIETCYHPTSTCRIGSDDMSVCDEDFKVKGISGLRIADASAMPDVISGNTNAPSILLGEMCAHSIISN